MRQRSWRKPIITILLLLAAGFVVLLLYPSFKHIEKRAVSASEVSAELPYSVDTVSGTIQKLWPSALSQSDPDRSLLEPFNMLRTSRMPDDFFLVHAHPDDPALRKYAALDPGLRKYDVYLYEPTETNYWPSEYYYRGKPAEFATGFIIHLEADGPATTKIEVFEYRPRIRVGSYFGWSAHTGPVPGKFADVRWVAPTTKDRAELLTILTNTLEVNAQR
jgi:hypothetical protein